ncbi:MAG TPA: hypothetical protein VFZ48_01085, partial [Candidatus Saccharimonadales bacterium]
MSMCPPESGCHNDTEVQLDGHDERDAAQARRRSDRANLIQKRLHAIEHRVPVDLEVLLVDRPIGLDLQPAPCGRARDSSDTKHQPAERQQLTEQRPGLEPERLRQGNSLGQPHRDRPIDLLVLLQQVQQVRGFRTDQ